MTRISKETGESYKTLDINGTKVSTVYVAGPMSGHENYNYDAFDKAEKELAALGLKVINPTQIGLREGWNWGQYIGATLSLLSESNVDAIALLDGWDESKGVQLELFVAKELEIPAFPIHVVTGENFTLYDIKGNEIMKGILKPAVLVNVTKQELMQVGEGDYLDEVVQKLASKKSKDTDDYVIGFLPPDQTKIRNILTNEDMLQKVILQLVDMYKKDHLV